MTKDSLLSLLIGLLFPLLLAFSHFGQLMRVDTLGLLFSVLALFLILQENKLLFYLSPVFLVLAFFTKFNYFSLAAAVFLVWVTTRKSKWFFYLLELGLMVGITFYLINQISQGAFFLNTISYLKAASFSASLAVRFTLFYLFSYSFCSLAVIYFFLGRKKRPVQVKEKIILCYFLTQSLLALTVGKTGSDMNYFYELSVALLLVLGLVLAPEENQSEELTGSAASTFFFSGVMILAWLLAYYLIAETLGKVLVFLMSVFFLFISASIFTWKKSMFKLPILILAVLQVMVVYFRPLQLSGDDFSPSRRMQWLNSRRKYDEKILAIVKSSPKPALSFAPGFLVLAEREGVFEFFVFNNLYQQGIFNPTRLFDHINERQYSVIILPTNYQALYQEAAEIIQTDNQMAFYGNPEFVKLVNNNYQISQEVGPFLVLAPQEENR